jgi:Na+/H+ antiporter NhaD/arsenite permease-like protein
MTTVQSAVTLVVFAAVILAIVLDVMDMVVAALLGVATLIFFGVYSARDVAAVADASGGSLALLFGGMVVVRVLAPTGLFEWVGSKYLHLTRGSGKRFLIGLVFLVAILCSVLPMRRRWC